MNIRFLKKLRKKADKEYKIIKYRNIFYLMAAHNVEHLTIHGNIYYDTPKSKTHEELLWRLKVEKTNFILRELRSLRRRYRKFKIVYIDP